MTNPIQPVKIAFKRVCGSCYECCTGVLEGEAHGHGFWKGRPCHYLCDTKCTIYKQRPQLCKDYECGYLRHEWIPEWMLPKNSGVIITDRETEPSKIPYIEAIETYKPMSAEVLSFLYMSYMEGKFPNFTYQVNGGWNRVGTKEFLQEFLEDK